MSFKGPNSTYNGGINHSIPQNPDQQGKKAQVKGIFSIHTKLFIKVHHYQSLTPNPETQNL